MKSQNVIYYGSIPNKIYPESRFGEKTTNSKFYVTWKNAAIMQSPCKRTQNQIWVFQTLDTPDGGGLNREALLGYDDCFNWTMTYRLDSTVSTAFGSILRRETPDLSRKYDRLAGKDRSAVLITSNCETPSRREMYAQEMARAGFDVESIGPCVGLQKSFLTSGNYTELCPEPKSFYTIEKCQQLIQSHYKFYLAFESSLCTDYITDTFFRAASLDIIPVVLNGADMTKFAPSNSFISANSFKSPSVLAAFLRKVAADQELYNSFFQWKPYYDVLNEPKFDSDLCKLCSFAHEHMKPPGVYENLYDWYSGKGGCLGAWF